MLTTLIEILRLKAPQTIEIPRRWLTTWIRGLCGDKNHTVAVGSIGKMEKKKRKESSAYCILWDLPDLGCYPIPGGWAGLGPTAESGWGRYSLAGNPSLNPFERSTVCSVWLGQESTWHLGPEEFQGKIQLAPTSPGAGGPSPSLLPEHSLLAPKHPQQCTVDPEGVSLDTVFVWGFRGKKWWDSSPFLFAQAHSTPSHSPGSQLALRLWLPPGTKVGLEKCCRFVNISWNFNLITLAHRHLSSQGLGFCEWQPPSGNVLRLAPEK